MPTLSLFLTIGTGTYAMWLLGATKPGDNALMGEVTIRVRYFYAVTLALNLICSGTRRYLYLDDARVESFCTQDLSLSRFGESS